MFDRKVQNMIMDKLERASKQMETTAFGLTTSNCEPSKPFTEETLKEAIKSVELEFKVHKEATIQLLAHLGFKIMVNDFALTGSSPVIVFPADYAEALANIKAKEQENDT